MKKKWAKLRFFKKSTKFEKNLPPRFYVYLGPMHTFELLVDEPSSLSQAEKKITVFKAQQIHKMTTFDGFD